MRTLEQSLRIVNASHLVEYVDSLVKFLIFDNISFAKVLTKLPASCYVVVSTSPFFCSIYFFYTINK